MVPCCVFVYILFISEIAQLGKSKTQTSLNNL
jgi:hypothetical protein